MRPSRARFWPKLESLEDRRCPSSSTVILPISAFLAQQGHDMVFTPPARDQLSWSNSTFDPGTGIATRDLLVDYTGQEAQYLLAHGINLHTSVTGFVTETPIAGSGLMEVSVNLEACNALTWAANINGIDPNQLDAVNTAPLELGYRVQDLIANPSLTPALSNMHFQITWQQNIGTDLPDLARLNENYTLFAPPGFSYERFDVQSWGTGTLRSATTVGTPGQSAIVVTSQVGDVTNGSLPGTLGDGFFQEPIDIIPVASSAAHVGYLNGTLIVSDLSNTNDIVVVTPTNTAGGVRLSSNLGSGTFANVSSVVVALSSGNNTVVVGNLPTTSITVTTFNGNNGIFIGNVARLVVHVGGGNNVILTHNTDPAAQFIFVGGNGTNLIFAANTTAAEIIVAGNGNNLIFASGSGDFIEALGNGNNFITDSGTADQIWLGGDGNNDIVNQGAGSFTTILAGHGHNYIRGPH
jgi:hypothetical protein